MANPQLKPQIREALTLAMKSGDKVAMDALRGALSSISTAEVAGKQSRELSDDEVIGVIVREVKLREEAATAFRSGGREQSAGQEEAQADVLRRFLPAPMNADELARLVDAAVQEVSSTGLSGGRAMGRVMGMLKEETAGRIDGAVVADAVKRALGMGA